MQEGRKFLKGALILSVAGVIVKLLGAVYRIPLFNILGAEGMGLFSAAYPVYSMMLSISTAGVPVAVSKLVAERTAQGNYQGAHQVFRVALGLMVSTGLFMTGLLLLAAPYYTTYAQDDPGVLLPLIAIAPTITFFAVKSAFRGYFQGQQVMAPSAISQVVDQVVRVITIFVLASILIRSSVEMGAAGATFGSVTGAAAALAYLIIVYLKRRPATLDGDEDHNTLAPTKRVLKEILFLALPITIGSIVVPLVSTVDSTLILPRLQAGGFSREHARALFGAFSGGAMPLVNVPSMFTVAIGASLVPAIASAFARRNHGLIKRLINLAIRVGMIIGLPAALGLFLLAEPVSLMLYPKYAALVARPLSLVAFAVVFISLKQTTAPILQGLGKTYLPVTHLFIGLVLKIGINYVLTAIPGVNILGPAAGTIVAFAVGSGLNLRAISRLTGGGISIRQTFIKPVINTAVMSLAVYLSYPLAARLVSGLTSSMALSDRILAAMSVLIVVGLGVIVYGISTLLTGTITRKELETIPRVGPKAVRILTKLHLLR